LAANPYEQPMTVKLSPVVIWLWCIAFLILCMVVVGGATRLTDSGLSITEWKPLLGAIPPLSEKDWLQAFESYKRIPEYQVQNRGMALEEFKFIYWWEWAHRFLGRFIGLAFIVPLLWFMARGQIIRKDWPKFLLLFVVGGLQGALGWYMVSSGLAERVDVSQYRLAAHLTLAFALFAAVVALAMRFGEQDVLRLNRKTWAAICFVLLLFVQVAAGGFVAGLDAGHAAYTWPKMNEAWVPDGMGTLQPVWLNWFENALAVQFNHRFLAYGLLVFALVQAWRVRSSSAVWLLLAVALQAFMGIATVVLQVPLSIALLHQAGALLVLALAIHHTLQMARKT
jgi:heme a synthase